MARWLSTMRAGRTACRSACGGRTLAGPLVLNVDDVQPQQLDGVVRREVAPSLGDLAEFLAGDRTIRQPIVTVVQLGWTGQVYSAVPLCGGSEIQSPIRHAGVNLLAGGRRSHRHWTAIVIKGEIPVCRDRALSGGRR